MIQAFAFYLFASVLILSAFMVITSRNPVYSVLFLILAFFNTAGLFILLGAEFVAMILVIVYVGAVAVLFLFVVMMLDINFSDLRSGAMEYLPTGAFIGSILLVELYTLFKSWDFVPSVQENLAAPDTSETIGNSKSLGMLLYTDYILAFQVSGLILLVAMIGAIVLTHRKRVGVRKQIVSEQFACKPEDVLEVKKITPNTGV
jgi:NADH-quinone oxidoreductase subunit J